MNMTKATVNYRQEKTHMMSAVDRSFTDHSTLQEDEQLGLRPGTGELRVQVSVAQLDLALCNSMDCSPPGSCVHVIFQAAILGWVAIPFCRGSPQPKD